MEQPGEQPSDQVSGQVGGIASDQVSDQAALLPLRERIEVGKIGNNRKIKKYGL
jgi:hypothetical protein